jgi:hypothetical protein
MKIWNFNRHTDRTPEKTAHSFSDPYSTVAEKSARAYLESNYGEVSPVESFGGGVSRFSVVEAERKERERKESRDEWFFKTFGRYPSN